MKKKNNVRVPEHFRKVDKIKNNDITLKTPRPAPKRPKSSDNNG